MESPDPSNPLMPYVVNHNENANLSYGRNKNAWGLLQLYRRLNPHGRNITFRAELSGGDSQNKSTSNNDVHLFLVKDQTGNDSTYYTARYNTTPGNSTTADNSCSDCPMT